MKILVSACLLGTACRYDGRSVECTQVLELLSKYELVPFCPEIYGGLATPRLPCEIICGRVVRRDGVDVTVQYQKGADEALAICKMLGIKAALLKEKSPSCGCGRVYDGSFTASLREGDGVTAAKLKANGIKIYGESQINELIKESED